MDQTTPNSCLIRRCVAERLLYFKALMVPTCLITVTQISNVVFTMPQVEYEGSEQKLLKPLSPIPRPWRFVPSAVLASYVRARPLLAGRVLLVFFHAFRPLYPRSLDRADSSIVVVQPFTYPGTVTRPGACVNCFLKPHGNLLGWNDHSGACGSRFRGPCKK